MSNTGQHKRRRLLRLFKEQGGRCWLCGHYMRVPTSGGGVSKIEATLDHLVPRNPPGVMKPRPQKAAHRMCNNTRGHGELPEKIRKQIDALFANPKWVELAFSNQRFNPDTKRKTKFVGSVWLTADGTNVSPNRNSVLSE